MSGNFYYNRPNVPIPNFNLPPPILPPTPSISQFPQFIHQFGNNNDIPYPGGYPIVDTSIPPPRPIIETSLAPDPAASNFSIPPPYPSQNIPPTVNLISPQYLIPGPHVFKEEKLNKYFPTTSTSVSDKPFYLSERKDTNYSNARDIKRTIRSPSRYSDKGYGEPRRDYRESRGDYKDSHDIRSSRSRDDIESRSRDNRESRSRDNRESHSRDDRGSHSRDDRVSHSRDDRVSRSRDDRMSHSRDDRMARSRDDRESRIRDVRERSHHSESRYQSSSDRDYKKDLRYELDSKYHRATLSRDRYSQHKDRQSHNRDSEKFLISRDSRSKSYRSESQFSDRSRVSKRSDSSLINKITVDKQNDFRELKDATASPEERLSPCSRITDYSKTMEDINESEEEEIPEKRWYRSSPDELYYAVVEGRKNVMESTARGRKLADSVREKLIERGKKMRPAPGTEPVQPPRCYKPKLCKHKSEHVSSTSASSSSSDESDCDEADHAMQELERKQQHPRRLHQEMWYNDPGEMNDGPLCRCSARTRRQGIRHGVYAGEIRPPPCNLYHNNADKLYHYRITISPPTNFLIKTLTVIAHDEHEFLFSGFSLLSHCPLEKLPPCKVIRFNIEYSIMYVEEQIPLNYTIEELDLFEEFLFHEILELVDFDCGTRDEYGCSQFHLLPRWERELGGGGGEVLAMSQVLRYLLKAGGKLLTEGALPSLRTASEREWQTFVDGVRGMIVTYPGKKPCSVRVDQLDRSLSEEEQRKIKDPNMEPDNQESKLIYPEIVHFGIRPPQLSYAGNPEYKKAWRDYVKFRHLVANMSKPSYEDKRKLEAKEARLQEMRTQTKMKRDVTVAVSAQGFYRTGLMCDVVQHAMLIPVLISHLRFHKSLQSLEDTIQYRFENRALLQLALTHPSYRENFGTNPDHARNSLTNCGIRQPEYGDRRIHYMNIRKRGINTLINIMSRFGKKQETESAINHNERLEFLGDAVVEFLSSIHLFKMFPTLEEGGLATYRAAIVQNQHLALLAKNFGLEKYMLYAHGSDLCHDLELKHAMANCFEALMGALFLDGGIDAADRVFALALWKDKPKRYQVWMKPQLHPLQEQEPLGDRKWIAQYPFLQKLTEFEKSIGVQFKHIRLLARAFTDRSMGFTNLTLGSNQRLEFLGDTVLQLISSEYLYKHFPEHHEGHLSLLRSSLVNNRTQAVVCDDLAMTQYAVYHNPKAEPKTKDKADLLEAFLGALFIEKGFKHCTVFCSVCLFPRLREFIMNQEWNDPKSKLQQCCLTLRTMDGNEPDIPIYKVIECVGPTNTRVYTVAVYFRGERLASAKGHYIQEAEMNAAKAAIANSHNLFPQLDHQKRVIAKSMKHQKRKNNRLVEENNREEKNSKDEKSNKCKAQRCDDMIQSRIKDKLPKAYRLDTNAYDSNSDHLVTSDEDSRATQNTSIIKKDLRNHHSPDKTSTDSSVNCFRNKHYGAVHFSEDEH